MLAIRAAIARPERLRAGKDRGTHPLFLPQEMALLFHWVNVFVQAGTAIAGATLTGAALGAILGLFVEWVVRSGQTPVPAR